MPDIAATWSDIDLRDFVPTEITDLVKDVAQPLLDFATGVADAAKVAAELVKAETALIPPVVDPTLLGIQASLAAIQELLNNVANSGAAMMTVAPKLGGLEAFGNTLRVALTNKRLPGRPNIGEDGFVAGFGGLAFAPDVLLARGMFADITGAISADDFIKRTLGLQDILKTVKFIDNTTKFKIARSASPQGDTPWTGISIAQFIPNSKSLMDKVNGYLKGMQSTIKADPLDALIALIDRQATNIENISADLKKTVDFIENAFPELPMKLWKVEPQTGGTQSISDSTKIWLDKTKTPQLAEVPNNAFVTGFFVLIGGATLTEVQTTYDAWSSLILP